MEIQRDYYLNELISREKNWLTTILLKQLEIVINRQTRNSNWKNDGKVMAK